MVLRRQGIFASPLLAVVVTTLALGSATAVTPDPAPTHAATLEPAPSAEAFPKPTTGCARTALDALSLEERVGQLFLLGIGAALDDAEETLIERRRLGSVTFAAFVSKGTERIRRTTDAVQSLTDAAGTHRIGFLIAANQEGGHVQALSGPGFSRIPSALAQGRMAPDQLRQDAMEWGGQLVEAGVNLDLAPVADVVPASWVARNAPIGRLERGFGHTPEVVEASVRAFIEGMHQAGVLTTVKHFPGLGQVRGNTDFASAVHDRTTTASSSSLHPFQAAIDAGVPFVMTSLASYQHLDGRKLAAFSGPITTGLLRDTMGFQGVVVSDDLSADAVAAIPAGQRALRFLRAGGDMVTVTLVRDARAMAEALVGAATEDASIARRIDESALRVLEAKGSAGLLTCEV